MLSASKYKETPYPQRKKKRKGTAELSDVSQAAHVGYTHILPKTNCKHITNNYSAKIPRRTITFPSPRGVHNLHLLLSFPDFQFTPGAATANKAIALNSLLAPKNSRILPLRRIYDHPTGPQISGPR